MEIYRPKYIALNCIISYRIHQFLSQKSARKMAYIYLIILFLMEYITCFDV